jgi:hypothetical protein
MKKNLLILIAALIFVNALAANNVSAQSLKFISAEVPFDFQIGDKIFPAGAYRLETMSETGKNLFQLRGAEEKNRRMLVTGTLTVNRPQTPKLVFYRIGDAYFLKNIFMEDGKSGFSVPTSRQFKKDKKPASTKIVEVAAKN